MDLEENGAGESTRRLWSKSEDKRLVDAVHEYGAQHWNHIAQIVGTRCDWQCRERWHNHLKPGVHKTPWSPAEDDILWAKLAEYGHYWSVIASYLPGRPTMAVKNRYHQLMRKQRRESASSTPDAAPAADPRPRRSRRKGASNSSSAGGPVRRVAVSMPGSPASYPESPIVQGARMGGLQQSASGAVPSPAQPPVIAHHASADGSAGQAPPHMSSEWRLVAPTAKMPAEYFAPSSILGWQPAPTMGDAYALSSWAATCASLPVACGRPQSAMPIGTTTLPPMHAAYPPQPAVHTCEHAHEKEDYMNLNMQLAPVCSGSEGEATGHAHEETHAFTYGEMLSLLNGSSAMSVTELMDLLREP